MADPVEGLRESYPWRMGTVSFSSGGVPVLPANPNRLALLITGQSSSGGVVLSLGPPDDGGFQMQAVAGVIMRITYQRDGDLVYQPLWIVSGTLSSTFAWAELLRNY